ncbi:MAG: heavy metal-associated domain-containing protein [Bacteroidota bacterium]|jgi:copper chaperone
MKRIIILGTILLAVSIAAMAGDKSVKLHITGMTCDGCVSTVTKALKKVKGVSDAKVSLESESATVRVAGNAKVTTAALINAVADAGYGASESPAQNKTSLKKSDDGCGGESCGDDCNNSRKMNTPKLKSKKETKKS